MPAGTMLAVRGQCLPPRATDRSQQRASNSCRRPPTLTFERDRTAMVRENCGKEIAIAQPLLQPINM